MPKMHQNTFGGRALAGPAGGAYGLPKSPSHHGGLLLSGGRDGKGLTFKSSSSSSSSSSCCCCHDLVRVH